MRATLHITLGLGLLTAAGAGCAVTTEADEFNGEEEALAEHQQEIRDGTDVPYASRLARTTVRIGDCTGTIIGPRHVLTSASCPSAQLNQTVNFYYSDLQTSITRKVSLMFIPPGVSATDVIDDNGKYADFNVLYLDGTISSLHQIAHLPVSWPGNNRPMTQVGVGDHDGVNNSSNVMRYRNTWSYAASNAAGHVLVEAAFDAGDWGGPIYDGGSTVLYVHGAASANVFEWAWRGAYTSTAYHFDRIAYALGHLQFDDYDYLGNDIALYNGSSTAQCVARCLANTSCFAYTRLPDGRCYLKSQAANGRSAPGMISGRKKSRGTCHLSGSHCIIP